MHAFVRRPFRHRVLSSTLLLLAALCLPAHARDWHVATNGNDANDGRTPATALRTLQRADALVQPGDTVLVGGGIYGSDDKSDGSAVVNIRSRGRADGWITWKPVPGRRAEIRASGWVGIQICRPPARPQPRRLPPGAWQSGHQQRQRRVAPNGGPGAQATAASGSCQVSGRDRGAYEK